MSWWSVFTGAFRGGALQNPDKGNQVSGPQGGSSDANVTVTDERAMMVSTVFACVRLLVQTGATLPLAFYTRTADGREPLDANHYLCQLLKYRPNNLMTAKEFRQALWTQRVLWGNGYAKIKWAGKRPLSMVPLKPEFMQVERSNDGLVYKYSTQEGVIIYPAKDIFHLKGWSADGIMGISALGYARQALGLSVSADRSAAKSINGKANAVLELDTFPTADQKKDLRRMYGAGQKTSEFQSDGGLMIVPGGMKYRDVSMPPDDLQLLESRQFQVPEICRFFGVPAVMIDGNAGATAAWPASYEQQVLSFLTFTLKPYLEEWEDKIPATLLSGDDRQTVFTEHNVEGLLRTDSAGRAEFLSKMVANGLMTRNEGRKKENLPPKDGADELTVQVNMTNLEDLPLVNQGTANVEPTPEPATSLQPEV